MVAAGILLVMAAFPGFPMPPFLILSSALGLDRLCTLVTEQRKTIAARSGKRRDDGVCDGDSSTSIHQSRDIKWCRGVASIAMLLHLPVILEAGNGLTTEIQKVANRGSVSLIR